MMYYRNEELLKRVKIEDLNVGDEICVPFEVTFGWGQTFRYPLFKKCKVVRITPKKTKLVTDKFGDFDNKHQFFIPNGESERQHTIAVAYKFIKDMMYKLSSEDFRSLKDEDIAFIAVKLKEIRDVVFKEGEKK